MVESLLGEEPNPSYRTVFVAYKTEKHSDKFITFLGAFPTDEAAQKVCDDDGESSFPAHHCNPNPGPNSLYLYYSVEEMELKS